MENAYYVVKEGHLLVLRQTRVKAQLQEKREHPHDVCAYATSIEEMRSMVSKYFKGGVDFSAVEHE